MIGKYSMVFNLCGTTEIYCNCYVSGASGGSYSQYHN